MNELLAELVSIKRLLVFALMRNGASQSDIAKAIGIDQGQVSRMFTKEKATQRRKRKA